MRYMHIVCRCGCVITMLSNEREIKCKENEVNGKQLGRYKKLDITDITLIFSRYVCVDKHNIEF